MPAPVASKWWVPAAADCGTATVTVKSPAALASDSPTTVGTEWKVMVTEAPGVNPVPVSRTRSPGCRMVGAGVGAEAPVGWADGPIAAATVVDVGGLARAAALRPPAGVVDREGMVVVGPECKDTGAAPRTTVSP